MPKPIRENKMPIKVRYPSRWYWIRRLWIATEWELVFVLVMAILATGFALFRLFLR